MSEQQKAIDERLRVLMLEHLQKYHGSKAVKSWMLEEGLGTLSQHALSSEYHSGALGNGQHGDRSGEGATTMHSAAQIDGGYVPVQVVVPITDTPGIDADGPHIPVIDPIDSVTVLYIRSTTDAVLTATLYCYNEAGVEQWTEEVELDGEKYKEAEIDQAIAASDYLYAKITAYTSGGEDISLVAAGTREVTA